MLKITGSQNNKAVPMGFETPSLFCYVFKGFYNKAVPMGFETRVTCTIDRSSSIIKQSLWDLKRRVFIALGVLGAYNKAVPMGFETLKEP